MKYSQYVVTDGRRDMYFLSKGRWKMIPLSKRKLPDYEFYKPLECSSKFRSNFVERFSEGAEKITIAIYTPLTGGI